ncbi:MAG: glutaminyl-peptide cyclotransferase [Crocinitomicaceae bacterium]|nr:glutaminyl-peptide cyclotransferase [Crocinitomicaceae bacterium]
MNKPYFILTLIFLSTLFFSCTETSENEDDKLIDFGFESSRLNFAVKKDATLPFNCKNAKLMDAIELYVNGEKYKEWSNPSSTSFEVNVNLNLGVYSMELRGYQKNKLISADGRNLIVNAAEKPLELIYDLIGSHPHNSTHFTQGYEFHNGKLFESTGNPNNDGSTKIAELNEKTGSSIREKGQPNPIFGEGITILGSNIYQVSWQNQKCFVYDLNTFEMDTMFIYQGEGWGLCNDGESIIMSNGTHELVYRDPFSFKIIKRVSVHTDKGVVTNLNEIEYHNDRVYANVWMSEQRRQQDPGVDLTKIMEINPKNGTVTGILDIKGLVQKSNKKGVPNGIAYRKSSNTFWLTGKYWNEAYEVQINTKSIQGAR